MRFLNYKTLKIYKLFLNSQVRGVYVHAEKYHYPKSNKQPILLFTIRLRSESKSECFSLAKLGPIFSSVFCQGRHNKLSYFIILVCWQPGEGGG